MSDPLTAEVAWKTRMRFDGRASFNQTIALDVGPPHGDGAGTKPMELLLLSLAACTGQTVVSLLQKMRQDVRAFSIRAAGTKHEDHPKVFTEIRMEITIQGPNIEKAQAEKALHLAEDKYCPVFAMLKGSVPIRASITIVPSPGASA